MADSHAHDDPNAAPMHHEIVGDFSTVHAVICGVLGVAATIAGIVLGLVLIND
ncbi:MAG: hypothetical protein ACKVVT_10435 [Dehalococcoidia bacterium]